LLTGRHQQRFGHEFNSGSVQREAEVGFGLPRGERIIPQYLKPAGYVSAMFGKWHLGVRPGYHPIERGFDEYFGFLPGGNDYITGGKDFQGDLVGDVDEAHPGSVVTGFLVTTS
jgi:arylsulfatase A-like enzyme